MGRGISSNDRWRGHAWLSRSPCFVALTSQSQRNHLGAAPSQGDSQAREGRRRRGASPHLVACDGSLMQAGHPRKLGLGQPAALPLFTEGSLERQLVHGQLIATQALTRSHYRHCDAGVGWGRECSVRVIHGARLSFPGGPMIDTGPPMIGPFGQLSAGGRHSSIPNSRAQSRQSSS